MAFAEETTGEVINRIQLAIVCNFDHCAGVGFAASVAECIIEGWEDMLIDFSSVGRSTDNDRLLREGNHAEIILTRTVYGVRQGSAFTPGKA
eukprot:scaffold4503_cov167-Amphora_coffeaeformis.AAC.4